MMTANRWKIFKNLLLLLVHPKSPGAFYRHPFRIACHLLAKLLNLFLRFFPGNQTCFLCGRQGRFGFTASISTGRLVADDLCFGCGSNGRTRLLVFYLKEHLPQKHFKVLEIGPHPSTRLFFQRYNCEFRTLDLYGSADFQEDISKSPEIARESFDLVLCIQVLQHVKDDLSAMDNIRKILAPEGAAYIMVYTFPDRTKTDKDPKGVFLGYGFEWRYGQDIEERLRSRGFSVKILRTDEIGSREEIRSYGLRRDLLFICRPVTPWGDTAVQRVRS